MIYSVFKTAFLQEGFEEYFCTKVFSTGYVSIVSFNKQSIDPQSYKMAEKVLPTEAVVRECSVKKVFLTFSQNSQENTWARVTF